MQFDISWVSRVNIRYNKSPNVSTNQLGSFLHMDSDIAILKKYKSGNTRTVWIWIGEENGV